MHNIAEDDNMGSSLPRLTVYTVLSNWNDEADTNFTTNQSEVIRFHVYGINVLLLNICI